MPAEAEGVAAPASASLRIEVAYAPRAGEVEVVTLALLPGATLADALRASGLLARHGLVASDPVASGTEGTGVRVGIWGKVREMATVLRDRDRVEIYRGLLVDPKEARRQRYRRHRERAATESSMKASTKASTEVPTKAADPAR